MQYLGLYARVLGLMKTEQRLGLLLGFGALFLGFFQLAQVALFGWFVQALVDNNPPSAVLVAWFLAALLSVGIALWAAGQASRIGHRVRLAAIAHFFERQVAAFSGLASTNTQIERTNAIMLRGSDQIFFLLISFFREHLPALTIFTLSVPLAFFACWQLALVLYAVLAVYAVMSVFITRRAFQGQDSIEAFHSRLRARIADSMGKSMIVQSYGRLSAETEDLTRFMQDLLSAEYPVLNWWTRRHVLSVASGALLLAVIAVCALPFYNSTEASIGDVVIFAGLSILLTACLWRVANAANLLFFQSRPIADFFALIDAQTALNDNSEAKPLEASTGQIEFKNVRLAASGHQGLDDFSLTIMPGERIAFTCSDGSASTITPLLLRFCDPQIGTVSIDGQDLKAVTLSSLRGAITYIAEKPALFKRSIMENMKVGAAGARQEQIIEAVKDAGAHDFIAAKQEGFHTVIDESFTPAQQRQLSLARAMVKTAPIVIYEQDRMVADSPAALNKLFSGRTALIFSNDPALLQTASRVVVLKDGEVQSIGPSLMAISDTEAKPKKAKTS